MKARSSIGLFIMLLWAAVTIPVGTATTPLIAGGSFSFDCNSSNLLTKKGTSIVNSVSATARLTMALDATGTLLTINVQNTSSSTDAVLYAIDLGLPNKFVAVNRMEASTSDFPVGARWMGPTDIAAPTNGTGTSTLAAREVVAGRMEEYLKAPSLPAGFLRVGQSGKITIKLTLSADAKQKPLLLDPVAYFLANDPNAPGSRMQIVSTFGLRGK